MMDMNVKTAALEVDLTAEAQLEMEAINTFKGPKGEKGDKGDRGLSGVELSPVEPTDQDVRVWIDESGEADEDMVIDPTLTMPGHAADAKVTGDRFNSLSEDIAKLGGEFELIDEVIYDGTFKWITLNTEPNGKDYKFKRMLCVVEYPFVDENFVTGNISVIFSTKREGVWRRAYSAFSSSYTIKSTDKYNLIVTALAEIDGGVLQGRNNVAMSNALEHQQRNNGPFAQYVGNEKINKVSFEPVNSPPKDTTMRVYGVRADA